MKNSLGALHGIRSPDKAGATPASSRSHWVRVRAGAYGPKDRPSRQREIAAYPYPPWTRSYPGIRQTHDVTGVSLAPTESDATKTGVNGTSRLPGPFRAYQRFTYWCRSTTRPRTFPPLVKSLSAALA